MNKSINALHGLILLGLLLMAGISSAFGQIITQPAGLTPGEQYQLVFVTNGTTNAESTDIGYYNTFVTNEADTAPALVALNTTWTAIASTSSVSAIANTGTTPGTGVPIYNLNGSLVAATYTELWSGSTQNDIYTTETGTTPTNTDVWTGTSYSGTAVPGSSLGNPEATWGVSYYYDFYPLPAAWIAENNDPNSVTLPLYAMSGVLTAAPEPGSAALLALGAGALLGLRRRRM